MTRKTIDIKTADGICDSYISCPATGDRLPAILFFMDGIGIRPVLRQMADRLAAGGYCVLLPNMFYRRGPAVPADVTEILRPENRPALMEAVRSLTPERVVRDAGVFLEFLAAQKQVAPDAAIGLTGYCMGGSMVLRTAAHYPERIASAASFHGGRLVTDAPDSPHRLVDRITAELYIGHADQDPGMTAEDIARLEAALHAAGTRHRSELYIGALHGFTMSDMPVYDEMACDRHWQRLAELYVRTLKAA
ncbi:MAG TPA: dienelactone hydrolase family protein [Steroidobacteraceae bacterium]|nr:dienelactone hydrolase family protein [Steroidobacteraceae bacterium]